MGSEMCIRDSLILALYSLATLGILAAIPVTELDIVDGLIDTLNLFFGGANQGTLIVTTLGIGALYTFWSNGATWAMGCNRAIAEAAAENQLPAAFAYSAENRSAPLGAAILMGVVCTAALILYGGLASTNEDLFWSLFSFSAVIFMLPYIGMVLAFAKLRFSEPTAPRPFRVAGGTTIACVLSGICVIILLATIALFLYVPDEGPQFATLYGVVVVLIVGELLIYRARKTGNVEQD